MHNFSKNTGATSKFYAPKGDIKPVPYWRPRDIRTPPHLTPGTFYTPGIEEITPWNRTGFEKLFVAEAFKGMFTFQENQKFVSVLTTSSMLIIYLYIFCVSFLLINCINAHKHRIFFCVCLEFLFYSNLQIYRSNSSHLRSPVSINVAYVMYILYTFCSQFGNTNIDLEYTMSKDSIITE